jgi:tetratricopeptide (TPR) repeat protein
MKIKVVCILIAMESLSMWAGGEIIRLENGVELHCEILEYNEEEGIRVKRLDNGGVFHLRWEHILDKDARAVKYARGYVDEEARPSLIRATRIALMNGSFEDGIKVKSARPGMLCLRRKGNLYYFRQHDITEIQWIMLEANEIFTPEELYNKRLEEKVPETAGEYFELGVYLESVKCYEKSIEIYRRAGELDPAYKPDVIDLKCRVLTARIKESDTTAYLDEVKKLIYRCKFALALERLDAFEEKFPGSAQRSYKEEIKAHALSRKHQYCRRKILTDYFTYMDRLAKQIALDEDMTLDAAMRFAQDDMGPAIRKKLAEDVYRISIEEVEALWAGRQGGSHRTYNYGTGTFILGPDRARRPLQEENEEEAPVERETPVTLDEKLRARLEQIKLEHEARIKKKTLKFRLDPEKAGYNPEGWWKLRGVQNKKRFLIAFYAEESQDMKILDIRFNECPRCCGKGVLISLSTTEMGYIVDPCGLCKTIGVERVVVFK